MFSEVPSTVLVVIALFILALIGYLLLIRHYRQLKTLTGDNIWKVLMEDAKFTTQPQYAQDLMQPYVLQIPEILGELATDTVTLQSLMDAKMRLLKYLLADDYIAKSIAAMPTDAFDIFGEDYVLEMLKDTIKAMLEKLVDLVENTAAILAALRVTEDQVMQGSNVGFTAKNLKAYRTGKLTIAQVLLTQPMIIVDNTR